MTCVTCQATIADKAIVCYRCGAPTAIPTPRVPPTAATGGRAIAVASLAAAGVLGALSVAMPSAGVIDELVLGGAVVSALTGGYLAWRRR